MAQQNDHSANPNVNKLLSLSFRCLSEYAGTSNTFNHYLLGITGIILSGLFLKIDLFNQFFSIHSISRSLLFFLLSGAFGVLSKFFSSFRKGIITLDDSLANELPKFFEENSFNENDLKDFSLRLYASIPLIGKLLILYHSFFDMPRRLPSEIAFRFGVYQQFCLGFQLLFLFAGFIPPLVEL